MYFLGEWLVPDYFIYSTEPCFQGEDSCFLRY
jgi:hypothetical protein